MAKKPKKSSLEKIYEMMEEVKGEDEAAANGTKAALRRQRVALSAIGKLCKEARKEILAKMK
jgi:hypothetical protein